MSKLPAPAAGGHMQESAGERVWGAAGLGGWGAE